MRLVRAIIDLRADDWKRESTGLDLFVSYLFMHPSVWLLAQTRVFNSSKTFGIGRVVGEGAVAPVPSGGAR